MLETLCAYGAGLLTETGEADGAAAALARYALRVAGQAAAGAQSGDGELAAPRWLDAEDATTRQVLAWAMEHDPARALRLANALAWWWFLRAGWPTSTGCSARPPDTPRRAAEDGAPRSSGSARPRRTQPIWPQRSAISPRSATPWQTGRRPRR